MKQLNVWVSDETHKACKLAAVLAGQSLKDWVERVLSTAACPERKEPKGSPPAPEGEAKASKRRMRRALTDPPKALTPEQIAQLEEWACEEEPTQVHQVRKLVSECLDHFRSEQKRKADWMATARNWISRDRKYREQRGGVWNARIRTGPISHAVRNILERDAARERARAERKDSDAEQAVLDLPTGRE